jgi:molybdopterin molybdotransferase
MTGASVPLCCNCVVRVEDTEKLNDDTVVLKTETITKSYQNIARKGEDCKLNYLVFEKGLRIKQTHLSTLAAMGITQVVCYKAIEIPIINTGNEIVEPGKALPSENSIFESNSTAIKSLLKNYPVQFQSKIVQDNWDSLNEAVKKNQSAPLLLFTGGVSAGDADYVPKVLEANGYTCLFHKVAMKPGKPVWLGINAKKQLAIGLPGNPISVMVNVKLMVERILRNSFAAIHTHYVTDFNIHKEIKRPTKSLDVLQLYTFKNYSFDFNSTNGSGDILNTANSEGFVILPAGAEFIEKGILYPWVSEL